MRTIKRYRFELQCGDKTHTANPIYDKLTKKWKQESNNIFFRHELQGQLQFVGEDYEFIRSCDMAEDILLTIYQDNKKYLDCYFRIVDCEIDVNHKNIKVQPKSKDAYNAILDKYNEEYNLMTHNPKLSDISMDVRPMLQVYELGADYVNNYIGSSYHKTTVNPIYEAPDESLNFSAKTTMHCSINECIDSFEYKNDIIGKYVGLRNWQTFNNSGVTAYFAIENDNNPAYRVLIDRYYTPYPDNLEVAEIKLQKYTGDYSETDIQLSTKWQTIASYYDYVNNRAWMMLADLKKIETNIPLYWEGELILELEKFKYAIVFYRLLYMSSTETSNIVKEDGFIFSTIYNRTFAVERHYSFIHYSTHLSDNVTHWGKDTDSGRYYIPVKEGLEMGGYEPLFPELWGNGVSYWVDVYNFTKYKEGFTTQKTLKDWVSMYEVLRVLLKEIDPNIKLSHGSFSSMFLWSKQNPITGLYNQGEPFMLAKSNATTLEYDYSATKTPIKISDILEWLKTINVYWDIREGADGNKYLRMEHIAFYMNGESYGENAYKHVNLKEVYDTRNGKNYAFRTNKWRYENADSMPTTIFYKWADTVSMPFEGEAMKAIKRLSDEKQETRSTGVFTSDIDYVFANTNEVTQDGFIVAQAYKGDGETAYKIQYYDDTIDGRQYELQNGLLSAIYFQKNYLNYDLAFEQAEVTGGTIVDVKRMKQIRYNEVEFYVPKDIEVDEYTQLTTEVGRGTITDMEQDMSSNKIKATLKYPIYDED